MSAMTTPKGKCDECGKKRSLPDGVMCSGCRKRLQFHKPPAPIKIPETPEGYQLAVIKRGRLYGRRPGGVQSGNNCPICGRESPIYAGESRSVGFRIAGWGNHLYKCFERALILHGLIEGTYVDWAQLHPLEAPDEETLKDYCKRLKVRRKDVPIPVPAKPKDLWKALSAQQQRIMTTLNNGVQPSSNPFGGRDATIGYNNTLSSLERKGYIKHNGKKWERTELWLTYLDAFKDKP